jgi:hypothetical protein
VESLELFDNNLPISTRDVYDMIRELGPNPILLKGKATMRKAKFIKPDTVPKAVEKILTLHIDLMFIESECFLVSLSEPFDLTMVFYLKSILSKEGIRSATRLYEAIRSHISTYWSEGFTITQIICDGEAGFKSLINDFLRMGTKLTVSGPNRHGCQK